MATLTTPTYGIPYPDGTERVADGDNAMGALGLAVENLLKPAALRVERLTDQNVATGQTPVTIVFSSIAREDDLKGDLTPNLANGITTINRAAWYQINTGAAFAANVNGQRAIQIVHSADGIIAIFRMQAPASGQPQMAVSTMHYAAAATTYRVEVIQDSGGTLAIQGSNRIHMAIARVGP